MSIDIDNLSDVEFLALVHAQQLDSKKVLKEFREFYKVRPGMTRILMKLMELSVQDVLEQIIKQKCEGGVN